MTNMTEMPHIEKIVVSLASAAITEQLGADIALAARAGDIILLKGALGAGKSTFARALIRQLADNPELEVPSPTYTICQNYDLLPPVRHFDLYRLADDRELDELGFDDNANRVLTLVEWPERLEKQWDHATLLIEFSDDIHHGRTVMLTGMSGKADALFSRVDRSLAIRKFLDSGWTKNVHRQLLKGDASTRRYEIADYQGERRILMDAPSRPDGPPVHNGKPYSQIAHLAEDVVPFIAIDEWLRGQGFAAPRIFSRNVNAGLLLCEDMGTEKIVDTDGVPVRERYLAAARLIARLHHCAIPGTIRICDESDNSHIHHIPEYDRQALIVEAGLFVDWYVPYSRGGTMDPVEREHFNTIWSALFDKVGAQTCTIALRDFHSPNLLWRENLDFPLNIGLIDFQDALIGPRAYDVASLAQDARVKISRELENEIVETYLGEMTDISNFDINQFRIDYAIMAAHRVTKILGIFVRLDMRDGKPEYLRLLPGLREYLLRSLASPHLKDYREWCIKNAGIAMPDP
jgi:N-acetylmuramate 1-kinase